MITTVEAFVLAVMTAIVVAIAIPSYLTIRDRDSDSAARSQLREAGEAAETYRADTGSYLGLSPAALGRVDAELETTGYHVKSVREQGLLPRDDGPWPHVAFRRAGGRSPPGRLPVNS